MKRKTKCILMAVFVLIVSIWGSINKNLVYADTVNFHISPIPSSKQVDKKASYFDLKLTPGETTQIKVNVTNVSNKLIHIGTYAASATTSDTGSVVYSHSNAKPDKSLKYNMNRLATTNQKVLDIGPKATATVMYNIKMPNTPFDGLIVGGITFVQVPEQTKPKQSLAINNQYAYTEAIVLHGMTEKSVGNLKLKKVSVGQINERNSVMSTLVNNQSNFVKKLTIDQRIYKVNTNKVLYSTKNKMLQVAPNSIFKWITPLNGDPFTAGEYKVVVNASADQNRKWHYIRYFKIKSKTAEKLNHKDVTVKTSHRFLYIIIIIVLIIGIAIVMFFWNKIRSRSKIGNNKKE